MDDALLVMIIGLAVLWLLLEVAIVGFKHLFLMSKGSVTMRKLLIFCFLSLISMAQAHEAHTQYSKATLAIGLAFDAQGHLWRASVADGFVWVDMSTDAGKTFSSPVKVNAVAQKIGADGEARPKIALSKEGYIYLTWTEALKKPFAGHIWFARSMNAGKSFEPPYVLHQDRAEITHRFDALNVNAEGKITVTWVDKRDLLAAKAANKPYDGAAIYYAVSTNQGVSFTAEKKLADSSCECCRIALTNKPDGTAVAMWRHVFPGSERDHMMAEIPDGDQSATVKRATFGHWKVEGCPHHGAALASGGVGKDWWGYHMAWFDGGNDETGKDANLFYARMDGVAWVSSSPKKFGNMQKQAGHPALTSNKETVWLVWSEKAAGKSQVLLLQSQDEGRYWGKPRVVVEVDGTADYPVLLQRGEQVFLAWNTEKEALKLLPLSAEGP